MTYLYLFCQCNSKDNAAQLSIHASSGSTTSCTAYKYTVKVIEWARKSNFTMRKFDATYRFTSVDDIKKELSDSLHVPTIIDIVGYIEPGHGVKGKQRWLLADSDLDEMYDIHTGKVNILLW